jgi:hypothetical protein
LEGTSPGDPVAYYSSSPEILHRDREFSVSGVAYGAALPTDLKPGEVPPEGDLRTKAVSVPLVLHKSIDFFTAPLLYACALGDHIRTFKVARDDSERPPSPEWSVILREAMVTQVSLEIADGVLEEQVSLDAPDWEWAGTNYSFSFDFIRQE